MRRWQVKGNTEKDWGDKGPDLLRTRPNARVQIKDDMAEHGGGWFVRVQPAGGSWRAWTGPHDRAEVLEAFDDWEPANKTTAQWGRKGNDDKVQAKGAVRCRVVNITAHNGCTDHTDKVIALCEAHNPGAAFGGAYVCKQVSGSSSYSEHAWGAAFDHSAYEANDRDTDWCLRMARENKTDDIQLPVWQVLGSQGGKAGNAGNDDWVGPFTWHAGGVDDSHEWHVHLSAGKQRHSGTPPCASKSALPPDEHDHEGTDNEGG